MFIDGGDPLHPELESLAVKPAPPLEEEGRKTVVFISVEKCSKFYIVNMLF